MSLYLYMQKNNFICIHIKTHSSLICYLSLHLYLNFNEALTEKPYVFISFKKSAWKGIGYLGIDYLISLTHCTLNTEPSSFGYHQQLIERLYTSKSNQNYVEEMGQTLPGMPFMKFFMNHEFSRSLFITLLYHFQQAQRLQKLATQIQYSLEW